MPQFRFLAAAAVALLLAACGGGSGTQPAVVAEAPSGPPESPDLAGGATLSGKVAFAGAQPSPVELDMAASPACARAHPTPAFSEEVVVNRGGTLRNVFVWVKSGAGNRNWVVPAEPVVLDQQGCVYMPHVLGVRVGQKLEVRNSDTTNHNVHAMPEANEVFNTSQPPKGDALFRTFTKPEVMVPVKCNVHPWMKAYLGVVPHPFFAVTGGDGTFTIKGLPPGTYTLQAWHEKFGAQEQQVTVGPKEGKTVDFSFKESQ